VTGDMVEDGRARDLLVRAFRQGEEAA